MDVYLRDVDGTHKRNERRPARDERVREPLHIIELRLLVGAPPGWVDGADCEREERAREGHECNIRHPVHITSNSVRK